jgi:hypothetical protein
VLELVSGAELLEVLPPIVLLWELVPPWLAALFRCISSPAAPCPRIVPLSGDVAPWGDVSLWAHPTIRPAVAKIIKIFFIFPYSLPQAPFRKWGVCPEAPGVNPLSCGPIKAYPAPGGPGSCFRNSTQKQFPFPGSEATPTLPPVLSTAFFTMLKPIPVPCKRRLGGPVRKCEKFVPGPWVEFRCHHQSTVFPRARRCPNF